MVKSVAELVEHTRLAHSESGGLFVPRMVEDEAERLRRIEAGRKGGNPELVNRAVNYPSKPTVEPRSVSVSSLLSSKNKEEENSEFTLPSVAKPIRSRSPRATDIGQVSQRFDEFWGKYPRPADQDGTARLWVSYVTIENEIAVFACLERYLESSDVARGVTMNSARWLTECHMDHWERKWPTASAASGRKLTASEEASSEWRKRHGTGTTGTGTSD